VVAYQSAIIKWQGVRLSGSVMGMLGETPMQGALNIRAVVNPLAGTELDEGTIIFTGQASATVISK